MWWLELMLAIDELAYYVAVKHLRIGSWLIGAPETLGHRHTFAREESTCTRVYGAGYVRSAKKGRARTACKSACTIVRRGRGRSEVESSLDLSGAPKRKVHQQVTGDWRWIGSMELSMQQAKSLETNRCKVRPLCCRF